MNSPPADSASAARKKRRNPVPLAAAALLFAVVLLLWRDLDRTKSARQELAAQNEQLRRALDDAREQEKKARTDAAMRPGSSQREAAIPHPAESVAAEPEKLVLQPPAVRQTDRGLVARIAFEPVGDAKVDQVVLVVRLPAAPAALILDLKPVSEVSLTEMKCRVDAGGKFAVIRGSPAALEKLEFDLTVSEPVTATVRGSNGIKAFEIDIAPGSANVRKL